MNGSIRQYEITEEHQAQLEPHKQKWIANCLSTAEMTDEERKICFETVLEMYVNAKLPAPKNVVFVSSPIILRFAGGIAKAIWEARDKGKKIQSIKTDSKNTFLNNVIEAVNAAITETTEPASYTIQAPDKLNKKDLALDRWYVTDRAALRKIDTLFGLDGKGVDESNNLYSTAWQGGNQGSGWISFITFFRYVAKLGETHGVDYTNWDKWEKLGIHSGPRVVTKDFAMISDRPEVLLVDDGLRPHNLNGPFVQWRDGSAMYQVHNTRVPAWIIEEKDKITPELIDAEDNAEVRRIMLDLYGQDRYLLSGKYEVIDTDVDQFGRQRRLLRGKNGDDEPIMRVEVKNSSPELDNTFQTFLLPVDPDCRPQFPGIHGREELEKAIKAAENMSRDELIRNGYLGKSQRLTCHNAVASTFGRYGEEYGLKGQIRQGDVFIQMTSGKSANRPFLES